MRAVSAPSACWRGSKRNRTKLPNSFPETVLTLLIAETILIVFANVGGKIDVRHRRNRRTPGPARTGAEAARSKLDLEAGAKLTVDRILALVDGENSRFGAPVLEGVQAEATVLEHGRERKVINFKMKRRKGFRRKHGHRQAYTLIKCRFHQRLTLSEKENSHGT